jgi:hypothetical protein
MHPWLVSRVFRRLARLLRAAARLPVRRLHLGDQSVRRQTQPARVERHGPDDAPGNLNKEIQRYVATVIKVLRKENVLATAIPRQTFT